MTTDINARNMAETAVIGIIELRRELEPLKNELRRNYKLTKWIVCLTPLIGILVGGYIQIRVTEIQSTARDQAQAIATRTVQRDDALANSIATKAAELLAAEARKQANEAVDLRVVQLRQEFIKRIEEERTR